MTTNSANSICDMTKLWEEGLGSFSDLPSSFVYPDPCLQQKRTLVLRFWLCFMVLTSGALDFAVGIFDKFVSQAGYSNAAATFVMTACCFLGSTVPPYFEYKVMLPGLAYFAITILRFAAMQLMSHATMSMLKNSSQLVGLAFVQHLRGKRLNAPSGLYELFCALN